jgi:hypothetical protein
LDPEYEGLRDTIFYQIFQNSLVMDSERDAVSYRSVLVQSKVFPVPTIYTLDGIRLRADGVFQSPSHDRLPSRLDYLFGEKSDFGARELRDLELELDMIAKMIECVKREREICLRREEIATEMSEMKSGIAEIERRYGEGGKSKRFRRASELIGEEEDCSPPSSPLEKRRKQF